ncbi:MAG TPA: DUF4259 domain-containing protein [Gemmatimonadales bacterium]|nr:DUF4259 domain-containing protein [Gemmatimonadales bacterium]
MGAWGTGSFENDSASDWVYELEAARDISPVRAALEATLAAARDYLDADVATTGLAAAEVVAALNGRGRAAIPEEVREWVAHHPIETTPELLASARDAVDAVLADSELRDLWEESEEFLAWQADVTELRARLEA